MNLFPHIYLPSLSQATLQAVVQKVAADKDAECNAKTEKLATRHSRQIYSLNTKHTKDKKHMQHKHANELKVRQIIVSIQIKSIVANHLCYCLF